MCVVCVVCVVCVCVCVCVCMVVHRGKWNNRVKGKMEKEGCLRCTTGNENKVLGKRVLTELFVMGVGW